MKRFIQFFIIVFLFLLAGKPVFAEQILNYKTDIVANNDGTMNITETIVYDFGTLSRHGIFRTLPQFSKVGNLYRVITVSNFSVLRDNAREPYTETTINNDTEYKIGDPGRTITGKHTYTLSYTVGNGIGSNYTDHDEIYWNIVGPEWTVPIASSTATIQAAVPPTNATCFAGSFGSTEKFCTASIKGDISSFVLSRSLSPGDAFSVVVSYPVHTFPPSTLQENQPGELTADDIKHLLYAYGVAWVLLNIVLVFFLIRWYRRTHKTLILGNPLLTLIFQKMTKEDELPRLKQALLITPGLRLMMSSERSLIWRFENICEWKR